MRVPAECQSDVPPPAEPAPGDGDDDDLGGGNGVWGESDGGDDDE